jgi:hypothetical protein
MDNTLNGINRLSDRFIVRGVSEYLGRVSRDGPTRAALLAMMPAWVMTGSVGDKLAGKKTSLREALQTGTSPVGISAAVATIFLIVVFLLL